LVRFSELKEEIKDLNKFAEGWRGIIYKGIWRGERVAVKVAKREEVVRALRKEARILERLKGIENFPQILLEGEDFFLYRFIEGRPYGELRLSFEEKKRVLGEVLRIAYLLDCMGIRRDEFGRIDKNVLVGKEGRVYVLDFERGSLGGKPTNLTQFMQVLLREGFVSLEEVRRLGKEYISQRRKVFEELLRRLK